jgi:hypothetical protein
VSALKSNYKGGLEEGIGVSFLEQVAVDLEVEEILEMCCLDALR